MQGIRVDIPLQEKLKLSRELISYEECQELVAQDFIYFSCAGKSRQIPLFKILLTNICQNDCLYCANRRKRNCKRYKFKPREIAKVFNFLHQRRGVEGIFISSGIEKDPNQVQADILRVVELLRFKYKFKGYIHSKILPSAKSNLVEQVARLSNRISLNLEAPGERFLKGIAPSKEFVSLYSKLKELAWLAQKYNLSAGVSTQIIVGIGKEDDRTLLTLAEVLYRELKLKRVYFSGFQPVEQTPLERKKACGRLRQLRLYQADFLIREYGYQARDLVYDWQGNLPLDKDPKLAWAEAKLNPVDLNRASREELIKVPGIGKQTAHKIISLRREGRKFNRFLLESLGIKDGILRFISF
jgi:predicted DNA-binding helix-hairpin-helix protein